jgi:hypothetical protein
MKLVWRGKSHRIVQANTLDCGTTLGGQRGDPLVALTG